MSPEHISGATVKNLVNMSFSIKKGKKAGRLGAWPPAATRAGGYWYRLGATGGLSARADTGSKLPVAPVWQTIPVPAGGARSAGPHHRRSAVENRHKRAVEGRRAAETRLTSLSPATE